MTIIVTDPCYINSEDEEFYENVLEEFENGDKPKTLLSISRQAIISGTGFGDWGNQIYSVNSLFKIESDSFGADSGMVVVLLVNDDFDNSDGAVIDIDPSVDIEAITFKINAFNENWIVVEVYYKDELVLQSTNNAFTFGYAVGFDDKQSLAGQLQDISERYTGRNGVHSAWYEVNAMDELWTNNFLKNSDGGNKNDKIE